jgi:hypothetical protein
VCCCACACAVPPPQPLPSWDLGDAGVPAWAVNFIEAVPLSGILDVVDAANVLDIRMWVRVGPGREHWGRAGGACM